MAGVKMPELSNSPQADRYTGTEHGNHTSIGDAGSECDQILGSADPRNNS